MQHFFSLVLVSCMTFFFAQGTLDAQSVDNASSLLWQVKGKGIKTTYIYGTIHMIGEKDFFLTEETLKALKKSKKLVLEIDMSNMMAMGVQMLKLAPMKGTTLKELVSEQDYELVRRYFEEESSSPELKMTPFSMVENWKPMLLQSFLYTDMIDGPVKAYEMELVKLAQQQKMEFGGLETVADQMSIFEDIPYDAQAEDLVEMIKGLKAGDKEGAETFAKMVKFYKDQDIDGMLEFTGGEYEDIEDAEEILINKRNRNWIPQIQEMSKKQVVFYAVGAGHLGGEFGVLNLLRKEGYKVTPLH